MKEEMAAEESLTDESVSNDPGASASEEEDAGRDSVDGEAVIVPGQRPGPTEPTPF
jgi:hypothetical protein